MVRRSLPTEDLTYVPALDGLRAFAVVAVLLYHAGFGWARGGFLGVSVFFTLSGFLITSLLLREWNRTGSIDAVSFWSRRLRRLTPAAWTTLVMILTLGVAGAWDTSQLRQVRSEIWWALTDLLNIHFVVTGTSYADAFSSPSPLEHFWSLAVESQFYVALLIIVGVTLALTRGRSPKKRLNRIVMVLLIAAVISIALNFALARSSIHRAYFGTDTRAAEMIVGALLACATLRRLRIPNPDIRRGVRVAGPIALGALCALIGLATLDSQWLYPAGFLATATSSAVLILALLQGGRLSRLMEHRSLVYIGRISYGIYVLHWPIFIWLSPGRTGLSLWPLFALRMVIVLALSALLFHFVETPIRLRTWPSHRALLTSAVLIPIALISAILLITRDLPPPPSYLVDRNIGDILENNVKTTTSSVDQSQPDQTTSTVPAVRRPTRILLIGDSIAASLESALSEELEAKGVAFASIATPGCGVVTGDPSTAPNKPIVEFGGSRIADCSAQIPIKQTNAVRSFDPDLVLVISTWESISRTVDGTWYEFGTSASDAILEDLYRQTDDRLTTNGAAVAWALMPDTVKGNQITATGPSTSELERFEHHRELLRRISDELPGSTTLDLAGTVCPSTPCPEQVNGLVLRPTDGMHFDDPQAAKFVADALTRQMLDLDLNKMAPGKGG